MNEGTVKVDVLAIDGTKTAETIELPETIFGIEPSDHAIYLAVKAQMTNSRRGTAATKNRALVTGGGKKPWRQKGRGTARAGSIRSPLWKGGGTIFGPQPHPYFMKVNKKVKRLARKSALSYRAKDEAVVVVEDFNVDSGKTRDMYSILKNLNLNEKKVLLLVPDANEKLWLAGRNIYRLNVREAQHASTYDLLNNDVILIQKSAVEKLQEVLEK